MELNNYKAVIEIKRRNRRDINKFRFKTNREKARRKVPTLTRTMYIRGNSIIEAYDIIRKVRFSNLKWISVISKEDYFKGVATMSEFY